MVLSLIRNIYIYGSIGVLHFSINAIIPFVVCFIFYLLHLFGAGDIKLFSIISSFYNFKFCLFVMTVALVIGAVFSIIKMIHKRNFLDRFRYFSEYVKKVMNGNRPCAYYDRDTCGDDGIIPFTICISAAVIICLGV